MKLSDSYKRGKGVFWRVNCGISLEIHPPHTQLAYPLLFVHVVILECFVLSCACLSNNSKWCLPSCWSLLLLLRYFLLNITPCIAAQIGGRIFRRKSPFATTSFKKGGGCIFESGLIFRLIFGRLRYAHSSNNCLCIWVGWGEPSNQIQIIIHQCHIPALSHTHTVSMVTSNYSAKYDSSLRARENNTV